MRRKRLTNEAGRQRADGATRDGKERNLGVVPVFCDIRIGLDHIRFISGDVLPSIVEPSPWHRQYNNDNQVLLDLP